MDKPNISMEQLKNITIIVGTLVTTITLILGILEYRRRGKIKRIEMFLETRRRFKENSEFKNIFEQLEMNDPKLRQISWEMKLQLLGFFEEVALLVNSKIIKKHIAHYMFGYYAIRCWESTYFCSGVNKKSNYWSVMNDFVKNMKKLEGSLFFRIINKTFLSKRYRI